MAIIYPLTALMDGVTINKGLRECVTNKRLKPGDRVVVCKKCKLAGVYLQENWMGACRICGGSETMSFPDGMDAEFFRGPAEDPPTKNNHERPAPQKQTGHSPWVPDPEPRPIEETAINKAGLNILVVVTAFAIVAGLMLAIVFLFRGCSKKPENSGAGGDSSRTQSTVQTDSSQPDSSQPDSSQPDSSQPDSSQPDSSQTDSSQTDSSPSDKAGSGVFGDANQDGEMNIKDAQAALTAAGDLRIGLDANVSKETIAAADVDGDGTLSVKDVQYILVYYANTRAGIECSWQSLTGNPKAPSESNLK